MQVKQNKALAFVVACVALSGLSPGAAPAQNAAAQASGAQAGAAETDASALGEIVVQARRRSESITDVPLSISVITAQDLQALDIQSLTELANYTPGLTFNNFTVGDARNDRGADRPIVIRGLNISSFSTGQAASLFLDGAVVSGNEIPADMDIGQVEVIRGPQSVYFGRSTMTGAVSYRTKAIPDDWALEMEAKAAQQNERDYEVSLAGPLIGDVLKVRLTGLSQSYGGYVTNDYNNGSARLGATSRNSVSTTFDFRPTGSLEFKAYVNYFRDEDGPAATAFVPASLDNCKFAGATFTTLCGQIPSRLNSINYSNTLIPAVIAQDIFSTPIISGYGFKDAIGAQRNVLNSNVVGTWTVNDYLTATEITGFHNNVTVSASDGFGQPIQPSFAYTNYMYTYATKRQDFSQELRLSSNPAERFSWTAGANFIDLKSSISAYVGWIPQVAGLPDPAHFFDYNQPIDPQVAKTVGIFGGGYFRATSELTVSAEARVQSDHISVPVNGLSATFHSFSPRVAADYDIGAHRKIYVSVAQGNQPGGFNTSVANYKSNPVAFAQIQSLLGTTSDTYAEEKLTIGEIGLKGAFWQDKGYFDLNTYYGQLKNQQIYESALIPALGFSVSNTNNAGKSVIYGVEFQNSYDFDQHFALSTTFAYNHTERSQYLNQGGTAQFGTTDFDGKAFAYVPKISGSLVGGYKHEINGVWNGFSNLAVTYRGKQFVDEYNAAFIPGRAQVDLHLGVSREHYTLELFVKNLLDNQNYTAGSVSPDYGTQSFYAFFGGWAPPRQIGVRIDAKL